MEHARNPRPTLLSPDTLREVRREFPVLERVTYLNTGTYGPMPGPALETYLDAVAALEKDGVACSRPFGQDAEQLRAMLAEMIGAEPHELAFTGNSTDGLNIVLAGTDWHAGDEVITTDEEHEALLHPLLYLQRTRGLRVRRIPCSHEPAAVIQHLDQTRTDRTRMLAFSHVSCETGTRLPATEMCAWASRHGIRTLLDVAQSLGAVEVNVGSIGCDYLAANGHKWLHGPTGTGFVFVRSSHIGEIRPAHVGAGSLEKADAGAGIAEPWPTSARFEFGTRPWARATGWKASLDWLQQLGLQAITDHMLALGDVAIESLSSVRDIEVITPRSHTGRAGLISVRCLNGDAGHVGTCLAAQHAIISRHVPHYNALRFSMAHFTDADDIGRLADALRGVQRTPCDLSGGSGQG